MCCSGHFRLRSPDSWARDFTVGMEKIVKHKQEFIKRRLQHPKFREGLAKLVENMSSEGGR
jgi:hypothetical protein